jgi:hypothetical protein
MTIVMIVTTTISATMIATTTGTMRDLYKQNQTIQMRKTITIALFLIGILTGCEVDAQYSVTDSCNALIITNGSLTRVYPKSELTLSYSANASLSILRVTQSTEVASWTITTVPNLDSFYQVIAGYLSYGCITVRSGNTNTGYCQGAVLNSRVTIDSLTLSFLGDSAIVLIPAPDSLHFIHILSSYMVYNYSLSQYTDGTTGLVQISDDSNRISTGTTIAAPPAQAIITYTSTPTDISDGFFSYDKFITDVSYSPGAGSVLNRSNPTGESISTTGGSIFDQATALSPASQTSFYGSPVYFLSSADLTGGNGTVTIYTSYQIIAK